MKQIERILCPVDFSETSTEAFDYANRLAATTGAELIVLHSFDAPALHGITGQDRPADPLLVRRLEAQTSPLPGVRIQRVLHAGLPAETICLQAEQRNCDLIVMGTHGLTGLAHLLLGSVAEHVLRHAPCPVLVVRGRRANEPPLDKPLMPPPIVVHGGPGSPLA